MMANLSIGPARHFRPGLFGLQVCESMAKTMTVKKPQNLLDRELPGTESSFGKKPLINRIGPVATFSAKELASLFSLSAARSC